MKQYRFEDEHQSPAWRYSLHRPRIRVPTLAIACVLSALLLFWAAKWAMS